MPWVTNCGVALNRSRRRKFKRQAEEATPASFASGLQGVQAGMGGENRRVRVPHGVFKRTARPEVQKHWVCKPVCLGSQSPPGGRTIAMLI